MEQLKNSDESGFFGRVLRVDNPEDLAHHRIEVFLCLTFHIRENLRLLTWKFPI